MGAQAARIGERLQQEIAHACKMLVLEIARELKRQPDQGGTPVDTGHARRNWIPSVGSRSMAIATSEALYQGGVAEVMAYTLGQGELWVSNIVPYIQRLNYGHSQQAPSGFVEAAVDRALSTVRERLARKGSFIDLAPLQAQMRDDLGGQAAGNVASAYSPFGDA